MKRPTGLELALHSAITTDSAPAHAQSIGCDRCGHRLEISVGQRGNQSGVLVERCANRSCANARPHQHTPTYDQPSREIGPTPGKKRTYARRGPLS